MSSNNDTVPDCELRDYLLGLTDADASERLDELSVCDDMVADRLSAVENDLVDAYVRGDLSGAELRQLESHYLSTAMRRKKVELSRALHSAAVRDRTDDATSAITENRDAEHAGQISVRWPRISWRWAAACALVAILAASTMWLAITNYRLRRQDRNIRNVYSTLNKQYQQLEEQARNDAQRGEETHAGTNGSTSVTLVSSLFIPPPLRSSGNIPLASVAAADEWLQLQLGLESDDFPEYRIDLKSLAGERFIWHSRSVRSSDILRRRVVAVLIPAKTVQGSGRYSADVWGIAADGKRELIGAYVFRIAEVAR